MITENTAKYAGGSMIQESYYNIVYKKQESKPSRSGDEIVADIVARAGLELS